LRRGAAEVSAMKIGVSTLERAFEIARSGQVRGIEELRTALRQEGYDQTQLHGPTLLGQLRRAVKAARESDKPQGPS
jgi:hypothetical protein